MVAERSGTFHRLAFVEVPFFRLSLISSFPSHATNVKKRTNTTSAAEAKSFQLNAHDVGEIETHAQQSALI